MNDEFEMTVAVTRYGETDDLVKLCLDSLSKQIDCRVQVLFLDQKDSDEIRKYCRAHSSASVSIEYLNIPARSLSYARNFGREKAASRLIAFCDADCILAENWAKVITETFQRTGAAIVGTKIVPAWQAKTSWYHRSKVMREFYSLLDLSQTEMEINKVIGASMAINAEKIAPDITFDENLDRQKGTLLSGGDTEYCNRVKDSGGKIIYTPHTFAKHVVGKERINLGWILKRSYYGGLSRALRKGKIEPFNKRKTLIDYLAIALILPTYIAGFIRGKILSKDKPSQAIVLIGVIYLVYFLVSVFARAQIIGLLNTNLPFRESYYPDAVGLFFVYALPLLLGYFLTRIVRPSFPNRNLIYYVNFALFAGILYILPYALSDRFIFDGWLVGALVLYNCMMFTCFFLVGSIPNWPRSEFEAEDVPISRLVKKDYLIAAVFGAVLLILNLMPFFLSHYLVGADVYYHASLTKEMINGHSISDNPYFVGERNYHYSIVYWLLAALSGFNPANVELAWFLVVPVTGFIFIFLYYVFAKRLLGNTASAIFATLFMATLNQILWTDPSIRNAAYAFMMAFFVMFQSYLLYGGKRYIWAAVLFFALTVLSHPEIALHVIGIVCAYYVISKLAVRLRFRRKEPDDRSWIRVDFLSGNRVFLALLGMFLMFSVSVIVAILERYPITQILVFNEWPLSVFQPTGISSFVVFLLMFVGLVVALRNKTKQNLLLLAVASLLLTSFFLFSHLWLFYHRYFTETSYIALAILAAYAITAIAKSFNAEEKKYFAAIIAVFAAFSLIPKMYFIYTYSKNTDANIGQFSEHLALILSNTKKDSVILFNPRDSLSRYVPFYADRYILQGTVKISKEQQWQVLSFCNGPYNDACLKRYILSREFFEQPSAENLERIRESYQVDYVLANRSLGEDVEIGDADLDIEEIARDSSYVLYMINS